MWSGLFVVFALLVSFFTGVWVMIAGWGVSPKSWCVIVGGALIQVVFSGLVMAIKDVEK